MLKLDDSQAASVFNQEKCYIYLKLPPTAMEKLHFVRDPKTERLFIQKAALPSVFRMRRT